MQRHAHQPVIAEWYRMYKQHCITFPNSALSHQSQSNACIRNINPKFDIEIIVILNKGPALL